MTTPQPSNQLPEEVKPPYKISEREPVFPCWAYQRSYKFTGWQRFIYPNPLGDWPEYTHWHPDQPTAPTDTPYLAP